MSKKLYIISGCNGSGKTTASYTILPDILECTEFVNADEIAKGLSPFNPESTAIQAGRLMLSRINELLNSEKNFAFETTLSTKSYVKFIQKAQEKGYSVSLLFFWLNSHDLAIRRVKTRVKEGGHNIPIDVIKRRYDNGLVNFFNLYQPILDDWMIFDNSGNDYELIAEGTKKEEIVLNKEKWKTLKKNYGKGK